MVYNEAMYILYIIKVMQIYLFNLPKLRFLIYQINSQTL